MKIFKKKWAVFLLIFVLLIATIAVSSNPDSPINFIYKAVSVPLKPVQSFFSGAANRISGSVSYLFNGTYADNETENLKKENQSLKDQLNKIQSYKTENEELKALLSIMDMNKEYTYIPASVIASDTQNWYNIFTINRGSSSGISNYDCVITNEGLVGKVISVAPTSAKVMSIVNEESSLMGRLIKTNDIVRIRGMEAFSSDILCKADRIGQTVDIAVGDTVETAENEVIFPKGITVGTVKEIITENTLKYAYIEPAVNFRKIDMVMVMNKKQDAAN